MFLDCEISRQMSKYKNDGNRALFNEQEGVANPCLIGS